MTLYAYRGRDETKLFEDRKALDRWIVGSFNLNVRRLVAEGQKPSMTLDEYRQCAWLHVSKVETISLAKVEDDCRRDCV